MSVQSDTTLRRRALAALRLPPLACGCRDPLDREHLAHAPDLGTPATAGCVACTAWGLETIRYYARERGCCPCVEEGKA